MRSFREKLALVGAILIPSVSVGAIQVSPGSPCAHLCLASPEDNPWSASASTTNASDISCSDAAYSDTSKGVKFQKCMDCLRTSTRHNQDETDAKWFIYNLRYTVSTCLYSKPEPPTDHVKSSCAMNKSCQKLQASLLSDKLAPSQNTAWDYCSSDDGTYMGPDRAPCLECLQNSKDQTYMANFLVALEAGCMQMPEAGTAMGLSGTVFSSKAVTIQDPSQNQDKDSHKTTLSTGAIVGIVIGVVVLFIVAVGLLLVHCHREAEFERDVWDDSQYDGQTGNSNVYYGNHPFASPRSVNAHYIRNHQRQASVGSSGEYYDKMAAKEVNSQHEVYPMHTIDRNSILTSNSTLPAHPAYNPNTISRKNPSPALRGREISPPAATHNRVRSNTPDSFAEQAYIQAAEDSARLATVATSTSPISTHGPSEGPKKRSSKIGSLSIPKIMVPKPSRSNKMFAKASPPADNNLAGDPGISGPILATEHRRFNDQPIGGPVVVSTAPFQPPSPPPEFHYEEVPLRSGKSLLYG